MVFVTGWGYDQRSSEAMAAAGQRYFIEEVFSKFGKVVEVTMSQAQRPSELEQVVVRASGGVSRWRWEQVVVRASGGGSRWW
jgi:hypothetical protein